MFLIKAYHLLRTFQKARIICDLVLCLQPIVNQSKRVKPMYWTLELASYLEDAPWPATKDELIDYSIRSGAPLEVVENLQELEDDGQPYESIEEIWPDYPTKDDFFFNEDEY
jgi:hypothetical protein